jgi:hypothetical protein
MSIDTGDFAVNCVNQGLFLGVNPHFLIAVAFSLSGIKDDTNGNRIGPFRVTQADWDAKLADPAFENSLTSADITNPIMQCSFATVQTLHAQDSLVQTLKRYPSADELYAQWPKSPALPGNSLQSALDNTRALILPAVQAALAGMDEGPVVGDVDLSSIAAGPRLDNAKRSSVPSRALAMQPPIRLPLWQTPSLSRTSTPRLCSIPPASTAWDCFN